MSEELVIRIEEFPYGVRCYRCLQKMVDGQPYSKVLYGASEDAFVTAICCVPCSMGIGR